MGHQQRLTQRDRSPWKRQNCALNVNRFVDMVRGTGGSSPRKEPPVHSHCPPVVDTVRIAPWSRALDHTDLADPASPYARTFWIPVVGPTCWVLALHLTHELAHHPDGFTTPTSDLARCIGLSGAVGQHAPINRTLRRLEQFGLARHRHDALELRPRWPLLRPGHLERLPHHLQAAHHLGRHPLARVPGLIGEDSPGTLHPHPALVGAVA